MDALLQTVLMDSENRSFLYLGMHLIRMQMIKYEKSHFQSDF